MNAEDFPHGEAQQADSTPGVERAPAQRSEGQSGAALWDGRRGSDALRRNHHINNMRCLTTYTHMTLCSLLDSADLLTWSSRDETSSGSESHTGAKIRCLASKKLLLSVFCFNWETVDRNEATTSPCVRVHTQLSDNDVKIWSRNRKQFLHNSLLVSRTLKVKG